MSNIYIILVLSVLACAAYLCYKHYTKMSDEKKVKEVNDQQVNPAEKVDGLEYDTSEVDPTKR